MRHRNLSWLITLGLAALFAFPNAAGRYRASTRLFLSFDIRVEESLHRPPLLQIYYDQGDGFSERQSIRVVLPENGAEKQIQALLPVVRLHALRLDYLNGPGTVSMKRIALADSLGTPLLRLSAERFTPFQTQSLRQSGDSLRVQSDAQAEDPHLSLAFDPALTAPRQGKALASLVFGLKIFAIVAFGLELFLLILGKSWINTWLGRKNTPPAP